MNKPKNRKKRKPPCPLLLMESHELRLYMCCHYSLREIKPVLRWLWERPPRCLCLLHLNLDPCAFPSVNFSFVSFCCVSVLATVNVHTTSMSLVCQETKDRTCLPLPAQKVYIVAITESEAESSREEPVALSTEMVSKHRMTIQQPGL